MVRAGADPADDVALADTVGIALQAVIDRLSPRERVAFVLHDSFGFDFATIGAVLDTSPVAARKLASRARAKVAQPAPEDALADWEVVDAFMAAARGGDFERLLQLLAPDAVVGADEAAVLAGTPASIEGRDEVATFFNGSAQAAMAVFVGDRPASAWFHRGAAAVVFDFEVADGQVRAITFRAEPGRARAGRAPRGTRRPMTVQRSTRARRRTVSGAKPTRRRSEMKTMTCRQLGGPCDLAHRGETHDDVINAQDQHLKQAEKDGDEAHLPARKEMKGRWRHPKKSLGWYRQMQADFAALPED